MSPGSVGAIGAVGVVGAGTMGAGIAQISVLGGIETLLHDPDPRALHQGIDRATSAIEKGVKRGRWSPEQAVAALGRLGAASELEALSGRDLIIEAAPEDLELKRELFGRLEAATGPEAVLATNTSSLSVTAIAEGAERPERIVGMHFFNPPAAMKLVEVVAGEQSGGTAIALATEAGEAMGRTAIRARDTVGFVANRCARPVNLEALRMLGDEVASAEEIDRVYRLGGGFRMGPFELMDLIGLDVNLAVARSFYEQSPVPRWKPSEIQERLIADGRLGRKSGRGFYDYSGDEYRDPDPDVDAERPVLDEAQLEAITGPRGPTVLRRVASQIANEAAFALEDKVASAGDIDTAMRLGWNWPAGPLEFDELLGSGQAVAILDECRQAGGEAYAVAPLLRRAAELGGSLRAAV
jgi:3-hydroxybutyryl-CoA dehydrogenase